MYIHTPYIYIHIYIHKQVCSILLTFEFLARLYCAPLCTLNHQGYDTRQGYITSFYGLVVSACTCVFVLVYIIYIHMFVYKKITSFYDLVVSVCTFFGPTYIHTYMIFACVCMCA